MSVESFEFTFQVYLQNCRAQIQNVKSLTLESKGLSSKQARIKWEKHGDNVIPSPNRNCPSFLCFLLPCLEKTAKMVAYRNCVTDLAYVIRDGDETCVDSEALVVGDLLLLKPGSICGADVLITECTTNFSFTLFDENNTIIQSVPPQPTSSFSKENFVFAGFQVHRGTGKGIVVNTGDHTLMGRLIISNQWPLTSKTKTMKMK